MACTTILVGKKASFDGSTMIARNEDYNYEIKHLVVVTPEMQSGEYKSIMNHFVIKMPDNPLRYTACPNVNPHNGIWAAAGINERNVGITATVTIRTNPRVLAADPLVLYHKAENSCGADRPGGLGEEDIVSLVLPYISSAREGVRRLGILLETIGTSECNGVAFNDSEEVWWLETIGGHHWIARRIKDEECAVITNQYVIDTFDFDDAFGEQKEYMCSPDIQDFIRQNSLNLSTDAGFNPKLAFGQIGFGRDHDHSYNTPRSWFMGRYLNPKKYKWDGPDSDFTPESDNIPWTYVPERKVTIEDIKYILSSHYQGTPFDPYSLQADLKGRYRPIGRNTTAHTAVCQIRGYMPYKLQAIEWIGFGSATFNAWVPIYAQVSSIPNFLSEVSTAVTTQDFYWSSRLMGVIADAHYHLAISQIQDYQMNVPSICYRIIRHNDDVMIQNGQYNLLESSNEEICKLLQKETILCLNNLVRIASEHMLNSYTSTLT